MVRLSPVFIAALRALPFLANRVVGQNSSSCKCVPGDACWPAADAWAELNTTVSGKLIANKPLAHVCHDPDYDEAACNELKTQWVWPIVFQDAPTAMMDPVWQNCTPFTPREQPCELGSDAVYSINVTSAADMAAGVKFANENNIRLVVRSTGHDFLGKSTGAGSLGLWTHNMRATSLIPAYTSPSYTGPAIKLAAGVRGADALAAAAAAGGFVVLTGNCPTVGLVGGWTQGGGHSALSSVHGMGADQVLEWEVVTAAGDVVTAAGDVVTASPTQNADLHWAMSGGGPGTYGVAASATVRVFPDGRVGGAALAFAKGGNTSSDAFWQGVRALMPLLPGVVDQGGHVGFSVSSAGFRIIPLTLPGADEERVREAMAPYTAALGALGIPFQMNVSSFPSFYEHYETYLGPIPRGTMNINVMMGGRLVPRDVVEADNGTALVEAFRELQEVQAPGLILAGVALKASNASAAVAPNALLPQWRSSLVSVLAAMPWDFAAEEEVNRERERKLNDVVVPRLTELTPGSGTYLNEASYLNPTWKEDYYGVNYERLREVKGAWDPSGVFYGKTAVGSDEWVEREGRLCRV